MSEKRDVGDVEAPKPTPDVEETSGEASGTTQNSKNGDDPLGGQHRALIFSTKGSSDEEEVQEYQRYLQYCGFVVSFVQIGNVMDIEAEIKGVDKSVKQLVALAMMESEEATDIDKIVQWLVGMDESTQKMLTFCRISVTEPKEEADCLKLREQPELKRILGNSILLNVVVETRQVCREFLLHLMESKREWQSKDIGSLIEYNILGNDEIVEKFHPTARNGLKAELRSPLPPIYMLKNDRQFSKIIGDGAHLKALDASTAKDLKVNENPVEHLVYSISKSKAKKALIIHNVNFPYDRSLNRPESHADYENLRHVLELMQFEVAEMIDRTKAQILEEVKKFADDMGHGDTCVLAIMSHGSLGAICGTDYKVVRRGAGQGGKSQDAEVVLREGVVQESDILKLMSKGPGVKSKPRLIIIQACRNESFDAERHESAEGCIETAKLIGTIYGNAATSLQPLPDQNGLVVAHSTSPGHSAFRFTNGSRFILALCATFYEFAHREDVASMMNRVNFIMMHGFGRYFDPKKVKHEALQLSCWTILTHKKFFLVNTDPLFDVSTESAEPQKSAARSGGMPQQAK